jgi:hypothetical protein
MGYLKCLDPVLLFVTLGKLEVIRELMFEKPIVTNDLLQIICHDTTLE